MAKINRTVAVTPKRDYWQVKMYGSRKALYIAVFDDKPTAERFALEAVEIGPFNSATVETYELNEEFGPKIHWVTFDEFLVSHKEL